MACGETDLLLLFKSTAARRDVGKRRMEAVILKIKQSLYTPWRRLGGEEI
jgi:hypothetical protein